MRAASVALWASLVVASNLAAASGALDHCEGLGSGVGRDYCVRDAALAARDPALCEAIDHVDRRVLCLVWLDPSPATGKRCPEMRAVDRAACWKHLAYVLEDEAWCRRIEEPGGRNYCLAHVPIRRDASDPCNRFDGLRERSDCYAERATVEGNPSLCSRVGQWNFDDGCYSKALRPYLEAAARSADWSACSGPRIGSKRADCVIHLARALGSAEHCESLAKEPAGAFQMDRCFHVAADTSGDFELCQKIRRPDRRSTCAADTATSVEQCAGAASLRGYCLQRVSALHRDVSVCGLIVAEHERRECYEASRRKGYAGCDDIADAPHRDDCHVSQAAWEGKPERCRDVKDAEKRSTCTTLADLDALDVPTCLGLGRDYQESCLFRLAIARRGP